MPAAAPAVGMGGRRQTLPHSRTNLPPLVQDFLVVLAEEEVAAAAVVVVPVQTQVVGLTRSVEEEEEQRTGATVAAGAGTSCQTAHDRLRAAAGG